MSDNQNKDMVSDVDSAAASAADVKVEDMLDVAVMASVEESKTTPNTTTDEYGLPITETSDTSGINSSSSSRKNSVDATPDSSINLAQLKEKLPKVMHLFEHFIVVGLPNSKTPPRIGIIHKPELLFTYPPDKPVPPKAHEFCFPNGISPFLIRRTPSCSSLHELLYGQPYLQSSEYFYTFVLTGESPLYGICVSKPELLSTIPNFFPEQPQVLERRPTYVTAPRSYCFLSKIPLFHVHFNALMYLLAQDRLITITRELSSGISDDDNVNDNNHGNEQEKENNVATASATTTTQSENSNVENTINQTPTSESESQEAKDDESTNVSTVTPTTESQSHSQPETTPNTTEEKEKEKEKKETLISASSSPNEYKNLIDKKNLLDILKFYSSLTLPEPGETLNYSFPGEILKRQYQIPSGKDNDEVFSKSMSEWAVIGLFMKLNLENILKVIGAILLEQRVVFVSDNLSLISSACFSMQAFIYPFLWQGLFVPIIPQPLIDYLEAPVPFIAGAQVLRKKNFDGLIVDLNNDKVTYNNCSPPPPLPEFKKLQKNLSSDQVILVTEKNHNPIKNTPTQVEAIHRIYNTIQQYIWWLVKKIENSFMITEEIAADSLKIEELKNKFLSTVSVHNKGFVSMLLDTQHFSYFLHNTLVPHCKAQAQAQAQAPPQAPPQNNNTKNSNNNNNKTSNK